MKLACACYSYSLSIAHFCACFIHSEVIMQGYNFQFSVPFKSDNVQEENALKGISRMHFHC